jgi:hypothetical protein
MAPIEFAVAVEAWREEQKHLARLGVRQAWHVAVFAAQSFFGKLKPLHEVLGLPREEGLQTAGEMRSVLQGLKGHKAA